MTDLEKVIKGLECLISNEVPCEGCPYYGSGYCLRNIAKDAMALLKEQPELVHCGECKYRSKEMYDYYGNPNDKRYVCQIHDLAKRPDWFCADGERQ